MMVDDATSHESDGGPNVNVRGLTIVGQRGERRVRALCLTPATSPATIPPRPRG